jgi:hypothetical protein
MIVSRRWILQLLQELLEGFLLLYRPLENQGQVIKPGIGRDRASAIPWERPRRSLPLQHDAHSTVDRSSY